MGDWLVKHFTFWGWSFQNWMVVALAIIAISVVFSRWLHR